MNIKINLLKVLQSVTMSINYEIYDGILTAIEREKRLKGASRKKKLELIEINNPNWFDLYYDIIN